MERQSQWMALGVMGIALLAAVGMSMARMGSSGEMDGMSVSMTDYQAVQQERLGYAVALNHWVETAKERGRSYGWQEKLGQRIVLEHTLDRVHGAKQEALGWEVALNHAQKQLTSDMGR